MKPVVERSVEIDAYGNYGQRDEGIHVRRKVRTVESQPQYVWIGNDRFNMEQLTQALAAVRTPPNHVSVGLYAPGTK